MKTLIACLMGATAMTVAAAASAASLSVVDPTTFVGPNGPTVVDLRYRLDNTNWDIGAAPAGNPVNVAGTTANIGNVAALNNRSFSFVATHTAGNGFSFRLFDVNADQTVSFTAADGELQGVNATDPFNALLISARSSVVGGSMTVSDIAFSYGAGLTGPASVADLSIAGNSGFIQTWLASTDNLAAFDWAITGTVLGVSPGGNSERVRFDIGAKNVTLPTPTPVPLPAAAPLLLAGLGALGFAGWRRRRA